MPSKVNPEPEANYDPVSALILIVLIIIYALGLVAFALMEGPELSEMPIPF